MLYSTLWKRVGAGYTIVEVLIVLAVTAMLFLSAITVFGSQRGTTEFSQAMQDLSSKIQFYANEVTTGSYAGSENYQCTLIGSRPALTNVSNGTNSDCIFLGHAIQALADDTNIYVYTVIGNSSAQAIDDAKPTPAIADNAGSAAFVLADTYPLQGGATVKSSKITGSASEYGLVGFYNGLPNDQAANAGGSSALILKAYPCDSSSCPAPADPVDQSALTKCLEEQTAPVNCSSSRLKLASQWNLCIQSGSSSHTDLLSVISAPGGMTTRLTYDGC